MGFNFTKTLLWCSSLVAFGSIFSGQLPLDQSRKPLALISNLLDFKQSLATLPASVFAETAPADLGQSDIGQVVIPAVSPKDDFFGEKPAVQDTRLAGDKETTQGTLLEGFGQTPVDSSFLLGELERSVGANSEIEGALFISQMNLSSDIVKVPVVDNVWQIDDLGQGVGRLEGGGRFPQDEKAMVLAGHATTFWPIRGPFFKLDHLMPNDEFVYIYNQKKYVYQVSRLFLAEPGQTSLLNNDNGDQLILVTCGQYNYYEGRFERRVVVLADLIDIQPIQSGQLTD